MSSNPHILIFPYPAQGHILPLLDLTHHLALKSSSITITIIITPKNLPLLNTLLSTHPTTIKTLILPFPSHPNIPEGAENVRDLGNTGNYPFINALSKLQPLIIEWFNSNSDHHHKPVALISDFFLGWTHQLAAQLGIPRIAFYSVSPFLIAVLNSCWKDLLPPHHHPLQEVVRFPGLPGTPSFKREELPSIFRRYRESDPDSEFVKESFAANARSWGFIFNTFREVEAMYLDHLQIEFGNPRIFAVGPLCTSRVDSDVGSNVLKWLDGFDEDDSVLYVCFGSQKVLNNKQVEALALGLERSKTRFVWVIKEGNGLLPNGYEDRVSGQGLVVKSWVPQVAVLGHRAVGGFLSHCGWNSVLEALAAGVAILGWPMEADQFINARLLVEDIGVAVRVCEGADSVPDPDELGRVITEAMVGNSLKKRKGKVMREEVVKTLGKEGQSSAELDKLVEALMQLGVTQGQ